MQYPVPQFTDVEDKIIGPLSLKQFMIIFGAGVIVFLAYTVTQSVVAGAFVFLVFGVPALGVAFVKVNGRPLYATLPVFMRFYVSPKVLYFHKEAARFDSRTKLKNVELDKAEAPAPKAAAATTKTRLKEVSQLLAQQAEAERELSKKI